MKVGAIVKANQPKIHKQLNRNNQKPKRKKRDSQGEHLSFRDYMELMKHDSYYRGKGGAIKQK